jgi:hypothetical protein
MAKNERKSLKHGVRMDPLDQIPKEDPLKRIPKRGLSDAFSRKRIL